MSLEGFRGPRAATTECLIISNYFLFVHRPHHGRNVMLTFLVFAILIVMLVTLGWLPGVLRVVAFMTIAPHVLFYLNWPKRRSP